MTDTGRGRLELPVNPVRLSHPAGGSQSNRGVAQLGLERMVRDHEVEGSNPFTPISNVNEMPSGRLE
jgi:hypothetical protein